MCFTGLKLTRPSAPCSVVAEQMGDEAMCSFMKSDGDDYWDRPVVSNIYGVAAHDLPDLILLFVAFAIRRNLTSNYKHIIQGRRRARAARYSIAEKHLIRLLQITL